MLNGLFTIARRRRYLSGMLLVALIAASAAVQAPQPSLRPAAQQATATVRIISGERITAAQLPQDAIIREAQIKGADGELRHVRLVEFP